MYEENSVWYDRARCVLVSNDGDVIMQLDSLTIGDRIEV
jgi:hypothetical protein